jgi:gamma-glutamyl phosphate reductase
VSHCGLAIYILKSILRQKKNDGNSNISLCKNKISKNPLKETKILQDIITNLKFPHKPKISSFKNPHIKIDLLLPRGQNPLIIILYESKHNILAFGRQGQQRACTHWLTLL